MLAKIEIIAKLYQYNLRKNTCPPNYTLDFIEDKYRIEYHKHSTGKHLKIFLINKTTEKELLIYKEDSWNDCRYEVNNRGTIQGYQHSNEPWINDCNKMFERFNDEISQYEENIVEKIKEQTLKEITERELELQSFREIFN